jgi:hypothetical protein
VSQAANSLGHHSQAVDAQPCGTKDEGPNPPLCF